jgi:hypothetical protein
MDSTRTVQYALRCGMEQVEMLVCDDNKEYASVDDMPRAFVVCAEDVGSVIHSLFE